MFREIEGNGVAPSSPAHEGVLRYPDGSINFDAYRARALRARRAAIRSSITGAQSLIGSLFANEVTPAAKPHAT